MQPRPPGQRHLLAGCPVGLRQEMLRPHLTLPGAGEDSESRLGWHGPPRRARPPAHLEAVRRPPYRQPCWPRSQGPAPAFTSASGAAVRTRRPPAELGASKTPRAGLAGRAPAVQRLAADRAGSRPIGAAAYEKAAGGAAPPAARGLRPIAARRGAQPLPPLPTRSRPSPPLWGQLSPRQLWAHVGCSWVGAPTRTCTGLRPVERPMWAGCRDAAK